MYELLDRKMQRITPKVAAEMFEANAGDNRHDAQRPLNQTRVDAIRSKIESGLFRHGEIALAVNSDGVKRLMNGQHTLKAVVDSGVAIQAVVENYHCETPEDFSLLFRQFDPAWSSRTMADMARIEAKALGVEWQDAVVQLTLAAAALNKNGSRPGRVHADQRTELLKDYMKHGQWLSEILYGNSDNTRFLRRRGVVAAMFRSFDACRSDASKFWCAVRDGEMLRKNQPEYQLRRFLMEHAARRVPFGSSGRVVKDHEFLCRSANAWNAFRRNETLTILKYLADRPVPRFM
jgi:hypothetical protein